jgi:hypothetical protein
LRLINTHAHVEIEKYTPRKGTAGGQVFRSLERYSW